MLSLDSFTALHIETCWFACLIFMDVGFILACSCLWHKLDKKKKSNLSKIELKVSIIEVLRDFAYSPPTGLFLSSSSHCC